MLLLALASVLAQVRQREQPLQPEQARAQIRALVAAADDAAREKALAFFDPFGTIHLLSLRQEAAREGPAAVEAVRRHLPHPAWQLAMTRATIGQLRKRQLELLGPDAGRSRAGFARAALGLLEKNDLETRRLALRLLSGIRVDDASKLIPLLADPDPQIAQSAVAVLRRSGDPAAAPALRARWESAPPEDAKRWASALAGIFTPEDTPALAAKLKADPALAEALIPILERVGDARGEEVVVGLLPSLDRNGAYSALDYLARAGGRASAEAVGKFLDGLPAADPRRRWCLDALARLRAPGAARRIVEAARSGEIELVTFDEELASLGDASVVPDLVAIVEEKKLKIDPRREALRLVGLLGGAERVPFLLERLKDEKFAEAAAEALGEIGDPRAARPLAEALRAAEFDHGIGAALLSLTALEGAEEPLLEILGDPEGHGYVVEAAARAAVRLGTPKLKARLRDLITGKVENYRPRLELAVIARSAFGPADRPALREAAQEEDRWTRGPSVFVLASLGEVAAVRQLVGLVKEEVSHRWKEGRESLLRRLQPPPPVLLEEVAARFAKDPKWFEGAELLAWAGKADGAPLLREVLKRGLGFEDERAAAALLALGDREGIERLAVLYLGFRTGAEEEARLGPALDEASAARLREEVWSNLNHGNLPAVRVLAHRGDPELQSTFREVLWSTIPSNDPSVQSNDPVVAVALARRKDRTVKPVFLRWLRAPSGGRRALAARCLGLLGDRDAIPALVPLLDDLAEVRDEDAEDQPGRKSRVREGVVDALELLLSLKFPGPPAERVRQAREALRR